jgi:hypothetical protein
VLRERRCLAEASVELAGERPFDATACLPDSLARSEEPLEVGGRFGVVKDPLEGDQAQRPVELAVAAAVQPVASLFAARGVDRARAGQRGEGGLAPHPLAVAARDEELGGADWTSPHSTSRSRWDETSRHRPTVDPHDCAEP